jgi:hypothetical protein
VTIGGLGGIHVSPNYASQAGDFEVKHCYIRGNRIDFNGPVKVASRIPNAGIKLFGSFIKPRNCIVSENLMAASFVLYDGGLSNVWTGNVSFDGQPVRPKRP